MIVTLNEVLPSALKDHYAVPLFECVNVEMARAVIETAEELRSPVICGTAEIITTSNSLENVASFLIPMAKKATVPVVLQFDHGLSFESCMRAVEAGYTSIMYDCSKLSYEDNVEQLKKITEICHERGLTVEGELGRVGEIDDVSDNPSDYYTDPDIALDYIEKTKVDALAVAVGNAHGAYKFPPKLDFDRISDIYAKTGVPLVLHGGSGLSDNDFREAIKRGICKVNIFTDVDIAGVKGVEKALNAGVKGLSGLIPYEIASMKEAVKEKMELFSSVGKA